MSALSTITHRIVEHDDDKAAGFERGYWYTVTTPITEALDTRVESAAATVDEARQRAREVAAGHGVAADQVEFREALDLLDRRADEKRVDDLISGALA